MDLVGGRVEVGDLLLLRPALVQLLCEGVPGTDVQPLDDRVQHQAVGVQVHAGRQHVPGQDGGVYSGGVTGSARE